MRDASGSVLEDIVENKKNKTNNSQALLAGVELFFFIGNKCVAPYLSIINFCNLMISN